MTTSATTTTTADVREAIVERIKIGNTVQVDTILQDVAADHGIADARVMDQLDKLERSGFVYLHHHGDADDTITVTLP